MPLLGLGSKEADGPGDQGLASDEEEDRLT